MKHSRELKVGVLAILCGVILYFGLNFLKGINIFSSTSVYVGQFENISGLTEQAPVYIKGCQVGLVETIQYDFTKDSAFVVSVSIDETIQVPVGTEMALVADGLLGGMAIELVFPENYDSSKICKSGDKRFFYEVECGTHKQLDFNEKCNKLSMLTREIIIVGQNRQVVGDSLKKQVENWIDKEWESLIKWDVEVYLTTITDLKNDKWTYCYGLETSEPQCNCPIVWEKEGR